jgi:exosome complex component RRP4
MYKVVIPGDFVSDDVNRAGEGTYVEDGKVYAVTYGVVDDKNEIRVVAFSGKYIPVMGDVVIGKIIEISFPYWIVDIASPYEARLHMSEVAMRAEKRVEFGNMSAYLDFDDLVAVKVINVDALMRIDLALQEDLDIGSEGRLIEISYTKVPRIIGRKGSMIRMLKEKCKCFIFVAKNGRIWMKGKAEDMKLASEVILMITTEAHTEAHTSGLTDRVAEFLDSSRQKVKKR